MIPDESPDRLEIFLALAARRARGENLAAKNLMPSANAEIGSNVEMISDVLSDENLSALFDYLSEPEAASFKQIRADYEIKTVAEQAIWRARILQKIGADPPLIDRTVHFTHIDEALQKEIPAVRKIARQFLPIDYQTSSDASTEKKTEISSAPETNANSVLPPPKKASPAFTLAVEKTVRRAFARQFVSLRDLPKPTAFDRLSGARLARLIRLAGIRETALACVRIEAVESVAAFLRRFSAEDAPLIAAQLNGLRTVAEARLDFAENLVQTALETEPQPSAMLDLSGIRLIGAALCDSSELRVRYAIQKLPLEIAVKLPEIIERQCRNAPPEMREIISSEIERLAETIARSATA